MSYLLTEIAMEMLGWQFYDTHGVARPINLEGLNIAETAGAEPLEKALGIQFLDQRVSVKAEADSSIPSVETQIYEEQEMQQNSPLDPFENESTTVSEVMSNVDDTNANDLELMPKNYSNWNIINTNNMQGEPFIINNVTSNTFSLKIQSVVGGVDLTSDGKPVFPTKTTCSQAEMSADITEPETFPTNNESNFQIPSTNKPVPIAIHANPICNETKFQTTINTYEQAKPETAITQTNNTDFQTTNDATIPALKINFPQPNCKPKATTLKPSEKTNLTSKWNTISITKTPVTQSVNKTNKLATLNNSNKNKFQTESLHEFELQQVLENELFKVALDVNREKTRYYKSLDIDPTSKANLPVLRKAMETYRAKEFDNLKKELKNLYELRQKAEHLCVTKFPKSYEKYLIISNALSSNDLLQNTILTIPINSNTIKSKKITSNVKRRSLN